MGSGKRERLAEIIDQAGIARALLWARKRTASPWLPILTYHRISDPAAEPTFDRGVIDATPDQFDRQVEMLTRYFTTIGVDELIDHLAGRSKLPPNPVMITFDDGYRDCHATALPILRRHGARAIFFVATRFTEERRVYWWDKISYLLRSSTRTRIELSYPVPVSISLSEAAMESTLARLARVVKRHRELDLDRFLDELGEACDVPWDRVLERGLADQLVMTWDEVKGLRAAGMDVQSHTRSHRVLATLPPRELASELGGSREELSGKLGEPVSAIAYPVGRTIAHLPQLVDAVRRAGYQLGFTNGSGINHRLWPMDRFDLRREAMDVTYTDGIFRSMLAIPYLSRVVA